VGPPRGKDGRDLGDVSSVDDHDRTPARSAPSISELGAVGVLAAVADAVFHATEIRVRDCRLPRRELL
jgi:CO/xanthine dehydrogenase Mo-binding subunit